MDAAWRIGPALRRSARAAALAAAAASLAIFATACGQAPTVLTGGNLASSSASVGLVEAPQVVHASALAAEFADLTVSGTPTPVASEDLGDAVEPAVEQDLVATSESAVEDELMAESRAHPSSRSGSRADEAASELAVDVSPEAVAVSEKAEMARLQSAQDLAALTASTASDGAALSASTAVQPTPKPVVKAPTPKPAPQVVRKPVATPRPVVKAPAPKPVTSAVSNLGQRVVSIALRYVGYRYSWGGISPSTGFDCSGFTYFVYSQAGRAIPRSLSGQYGTGRAIARSALQPGDLLFFHDTSRSGLSHAAIYIGGGRFVNAQSERVGVAIASLGSSYWSSHYLGARRP